MQHNYGLLLKRSDPPPRLLELFGHFFVGWFVFRAFGALFVSYFTKIMGKSAQKLLDLVKPPLFYPKFQNCWCTKSAPKTFGLTRTPPPPLWKKSIIKLHFSKHRPFGPMLSISRFVRLCVCLSVRVFTFEVPFNGLFAPTSRSRMSNSFRDSESLGKSNGKKWSHI